VAQPPDEQPAHPPPPTRDVVPSLPLLKLANVDTLRRVSSP